MTAVAPPPNFQSVSRPGWSAPNGASNGLAPTAEEVSRMFMPRRTMQRTGSSSSTASTASSNGTITATTAQSNGFPNVGPGDGSTWGTKKKTARGLWPPSEAKPVAGLSTARSQPIASTSSGPSAASAISALHTPTPMLPSQQNGQPQTQQNGLPRAPMQPENPAVLYLIPMNGTFERKTITVPYYPDVMKIGRQTNNKTQPTPLNGYFDSKVLSRQHAEIWADRNGKIWIRDVKSSNGTFVNGQRLSQENRDSDPHELREQDMLELGIDIVSEDQKTIVHHKVAARVEHAGFYSAGGNNVLDLNFGDLDASNGIVNGGLVQGMGQMRGRTGSQGSMSSGMRTPASMSSSNMNAMGQQRHINFWLQPISMEQVVKRLNSELKQAKQQSQDLQRTSHYIDAVLTNDPKKETKSPATSHTKPSPIKGDNKARFSEPPAPPPQQPLPEKPDVAPYQSLLRRADTERPRLNGSPVRSEQTQLTSLAEALTSAKKEIESQSIRLKDLERLLAQERQARETAEERAQRLEAESLKQQGSELAQAQLDAQNDGQPPEAVSEEVPAKPTEKEHKDDSTSVDAVTIRLQQRLEKMVAEMDEMKQQMEQYRHRAENAEAESSRHRQSLSEMVEKIRKDEAERSARSSSGSRGRKSSRHTHQTATAVTENGTLKAPLDETADEIEKAREVLRKAGVQNGRPVTPEQAEELAKALSQSLTTRQASGHQDLFAHGAPVVSMVTIVLAGAAIMAWLNSWPKMER